MNIKTVFYFSFITILIFLSGCGGIEKDETKRILLKSFEFSKHFTEYELKLTNPDVEDSVDIENLDVYLKTVFDSYTDLLKNYLLEITSAIEIITRDQEKLENTKCPPQFVISLEKYKQKLIELRTRKDYMFKEAKIVSEGGNRFELKILEFQSLIKGETKNTKLNEIHQHLDEACKIAVNLKLVSMNDPEFAKRYEEFLLDLRKIESMDL